MRHLLRGRFGPRRLSQQLNGSSRLVFRGAELVRLQVWQMASWSHPWPVCPKMIMAAVPKGDHFPRVSPKMIMVGWRDDHVFLCFSQDDHGWGGGGRGKRELATCFTGPGPR